MSEAAKGRFATKYTVASNGCWEWNVGGSARHRPNFLLNGRHEVAARASYLLFKGPIPSGLFVCHACDNPKCVNPSHLWLGTPAENTRDFYAKGLHVPRRGRVSTANIRRGASHPKATISPEVAASIFARVRGGETQASLVRELGLSAGIVCRIAKGDHWSFRLTDTSAEPIPTN